MITAELDAIASAAERRWGIDRLPLLVPADMAARFKAMMAIMRGDAPTPAGQTAEAVRAAMGRAWTALSNHASATGQAEAASLTWTAAPPAYGELPDIDRPWYILPMPSGYQAAICADEPHEIRVRATASHLGIKVDTFTAKAVVHIAMAGAAITMADILSNASTVGAVTAAWPGAEVLPRVGRLPKDAIPFGDIAA